MKKKVVVLGSTGSIGINTLKFFKKYKKNFKIEFLSTNTNTKLVLRQSKQFNVKNIIITDKSEFFKAKKKYKKFNINFYNSFDILNIKLKKKKSFIQ
jgi:1-deoxy-D-xylulose-5-phosphate reductoisomerase